MTRRSLAGAALAAAALALAGSAAAQPIVGKGTPKGTLAAYGYHLYGEYCLGCHGANAAGQTTRPTYATGFGPDRATGQQRGIAPSLHGVGALAADFYLRTGYMPLPRDDIQPRHRFHLLLADKQIRALVAYVASFGGPKIPTPHPERGNLSKGQNLFTEHCAGCHQVVAQGGYVTGAVPPPLVEGTTPLEVAEAVRIGPYVMPRFTKKDLSDEELDSIIRYVQYAQHPDHPGGWDLNFLGPVPEGLVTWFLAAVVLVGICMVIGRRLKA
jgi:ubiquinol-cytochrome c reductase cytochrome c subunit